MPDIVSSCGSNVSRLRKVRGFSISDLARRSGVAKGIISRLESGTGNPTLETIQALADALGVLMTDLVTTQRDEPFVLRLADSDVLVGQGLTGRVLDRVVSRNAIDVLEATYRATEKRELPGDPPGTVKRIFVVDGTVRIELPDEVITLSGGDYIRFASDVPHSFIAETDEATILGLADFGVVQFEKPSVRPNGAGSP
jgi:transcriptional regulator with XRE-family HTH domain